MKNDAQKFTFAPYIYLADDNKNRVADDIYEVCKRIGFNAKNIVHVGAASSGDIECLEFIKSGAKCVLVEPKPDFYQELVNNWGSYPNISIFNLGIHNKVGKFKFYDRWASTVLEEFASIPNLLDRPITNEDTSFWANCILMSGIDDGGIDLLILDTNGNEYFTLQHLKSRPVIICIECHYIHSGYRNPYLNEIISWLDENEYGILAINETDLVATRCLDVVGEKSETKEERTSKIRKVIELLANSLDKVKDKKNEK